ncbi:MAG: TetR/AcrR family transcriptional regulator [Verrucomicrobiota bacterium]|jgi:AcrR family transcriptional regulator
MSQNGQVSVNNTRDPDATRARILAAALVEFAAHGFAGARVDAIARRARGNKRMLYHYFGNKEALFRAVMRHKMAQRRAWSVAISNDPAERLPFWFKNACEDPDWVRLLLWEALQRPAKLIHGKERRAASADWLDRMRQRQRSGQMTTAADPRHLALAMQSLTMFPAAFPQLVRLATGRSLDDPGFQHGYQKFLRKFAAAFRPASRRKKRSDREKLDQGG